MRFALAFVLAIASAALMAAPGLFSFAPGVTFNVLAGETAVIEFENEYGWNAGGVLTGPDSYTCFSGHVGCRASVTGGEAEPAELGAIDYTNTAHLLQAVLVMGCAGSLWAGFRSGDKL